MVEEKSNSQAHTVPACSILVVHVGLQLYSTEMAVPWALVFIYIIISLNTFFFLGEGRGWPAAWTHGLFAAVRVAAAVIIIIIKSQILFLSSKKKKEKRFHF